MHETQPLPQAQHLQHHIQLSAGAARADGPRPHAHQHQTVESTAWMHNTCMCQARQRKCVPSLDFHASFCQVLLPWCPQSYNARLRLPALVDPLAPYTVLSSGQCHVMVMVAQLHADRSFIPFADQAQQASPATCSALQAARHYPGPVLLTAAHWSETGRPGARTRTVNLFSRLVSSSSVASFSSRLMILPNSLRASQGQVGEVQGCLLAEIRLWTGRAKSTHGKGMMQGGDFRA